MIARAVPERIAADAEHDGVAGSQHAGRVGEHVGSALEHEPDDTQRSAPGLDLPRAVVVRSSAPRRVERRRAATRADPRSSPAASTAVSANRVVDLPRAAAAATSAWLAWSMRFEDCVVGQPIGERRRRSRSVAGRRPRRARRTRRPPRPTARETSSYSARGMCSRSPESCTTTRRSPGLEARGELVVDDGRSVAAERHQLTGVQAGQRLPGRASPGDDSDLDAGLTARSVRAWIASSRVSEPARPGSATPYAAARSTHPLRHAPGGPSSTWRITWAGSIGGRDWPPTRQHAPDESAIDAPPSPVRSRATRLADWIDAGVAALVASARRPRPGCAHVAPILRPAGRRSVAPTAGARDAGARVGRRAGGRRDVAPRS